MTDFSKTEVERKHSLERSQRDSQGLVLLPSSHHVPAKGGQTAVLIERSKFFKNRERLVHGHNIRWVNSTTQEFLRDEVASELGAAITSPTPQTLTSSFSRVAFTARQILSNGTRKISGRGNCSILRSRQRVYSL